MRTGLRHTRLLNAKLKETPQQECVNVQAAGIHCQALFR